MVQSLFFCPSIRPAQSNLGRVEGKETEGHMANEQNLRPFSALTEKEQREIRSKGGKASGKSRSEVSSIRKILKIWAEKPITSAKLKAQAEAMGIDTNEGRALLTLAIVQNAMRGNSKYMEYALKLLGEDTGHSDALDDGFIEALKGSASADWESGDDV